MTFSRLISAACLLVATTAAPVFAQDAASAAVKARKAHMQLYAFNIGALGAMAKGEMDYDGEAAQRAATNIVALANMDTRAFWIPGTAVGDVEDTRALAKMWEAGSQVGEKAGALREAAAAMESSAGEGLGALQAAIGGLGKSCGGCHELYRQPKN